MAYHISHITYRRIKFLLFAICYLLFANLMGCAMVKEGAKAIAGVSTKNLEKERAGAVTKIFSYDYNTCYDKTRAILQHLGAYIYAQDAKKQMIAVYVSETDTTPVGLFFQKINETQTQIEVSSPSTYAKEFISSKIFSNLEKPLILEQGGGETDAK